MSNAKRYFDQVTHKPKFLIGDRVRGVWNKIPFTGTVAVEHLVNLEEGPKVHIFLDLPIKYKDAVLNIITARPKDVKALK